MFDESLIPISAAPRHFPGRPHIATVHRYVGSGYRGIRLETIKVGGRRFTSKQAIERFIRKTSSLGSATTPQVLRKPAADVDDALDAAGL